MSAQTLRSWLPVVMALAMIVSAGEGARGYSSNGPVWRSPLVFWDEAFRFFSGATGCSIGFFIEDIATHEFGHALGLGHSTTTGATMYPTVSYCSIEPRSLHADDIAGIVSLYPPAVPPPLAPTGFRIR